ncbi:MAG: hypothetical protein Q4P06_08095 [Actinomycetaceae bacterium]|nr:hypothetical protein [Actinomycetaceae bacterium]
MREKKAFPAWLKTSATPPARDAIDSGCDLLYVCTGNICRSAYLHARTAAELSSAWVVESAGTGAVVGHDVEDFMRRELDLRKVEHCHAARQVTPKILRSSGLIVAFTKRHWRFVIQDEPTVLRRAFTAYALSQSAKQVYSSREFEELVSISATTQHEGSISSHPVFIQWRDLLYATMRDQGGPAAFADVEDPYMRGQEAATACARECDELLEPVLTSLRALNLG